MLRRTGQAMVDLGHRLHGVCAMLLTLAVLVSVVTGGLAWRLSRGPLPLDIFKDRIEAAFNDGGSLHVHLGSVSVAWNGFSHGLNQPLVLRVADLSLAQVQTVAGGEPAHIHIPVVETSLSARGLMTGRIMPRTILLEGARLTVTRREDGTLGVDVGGASDTPAGTSPLIGLLAVLGSPAGSDDQAAGGARFSQLTSVAIRGATALLDDRLLGVTWTAQKADMVLSRHPGGGMDGRATAVLAQTGTHALLAAAFTLAPQARSTHIEARLAGLEPATLAAMTPALAPLAALDSVVTLDGEGDLGPALDLTRARVNAHFTQGRVKAAGGEVPFRAADFTVSGNLAEGALERGAITFQPRSGGPVSILAGSGQFSQRDGHPVGSVHLMLDHLDFADLQGLWPPAVSPPFREWMTKNVSAGTARDGKGDFAFGLPAGGVGDPPAGGVGVVLTQTKATLEIDNATVTWLPALPAAEKVQGHVVLSTPDKVDIDIKTGRQKVNGADPLTVQGGRVTIVGLSKKDQVATVRCDAGGPVASAISLLKEPKLHLLSDHPLDLSGAAGDVRASFQAVVPLEKWLTFDDVTFHATGVTSKLHLGGIAGGRDLDDAALTFDVDPKGATFKGTGAVAGVAATLDGMMDFRAGPPAQVVRRIAAAGRPSVQNLAAMGLDSGGALSGEVGIHTVYSGYRNGDGDLAIDADLTPAGLMVAPLGWRKPVGTQARATAQVKLAHGELAAIDRVAIDGAGITVRGGLTMPGGQPGVARLDKVVLGRTDLSGTIRWPVKGPVSVELGGPALDLSTKLLEKSSKAGPGTAWSVRSHFDRLFLAHDLAASQVSAAAEYDGTVFRGLEIAGNTGSGKPFTARIGHGAGGRRALAVTAEDGGGLLNGLNITGTVQEGTLAIDGVFDDASPFHPLSGTVTLDDFRVTHAPLLGKLLQAVTLYGLVDALNGSGVVFSKLVAPFQGDTDMISFHDVRAFSPSLGLTAKGRLDLAADRMDVEGTVVPAYVFNSLLGRIPLLGRLFSAETGGGLFAMNYSLHGPMDDPSVMANPLSVVTPGILRGMFGIFDQAPLDRGSPGVKGQNP